MTAARFVIAFLLTMPAVLASATTYTISGQVTVGGAGLSGVTIDVNGSETLSATTGFSGSYSFALAGGGTYTLSAALSGYSFNPPSYTFSNLSANQTANFAGASVSALDFYPVTPCRIADTRTGAGFTGQFAPPTMAGGATRTFNILSSPCAAGIPATVAAYSLNFTVVPPAGGPAANLSTWPTGLGTGMPNVSTLNYYGSVAANAAIVPAGTNGAINIYVVDPTDVLFDINGYFAPPLSSGLEFYPVAPCRVADTRTGAGFSGAYGPPSMAGGATRTFTISNSCGIPTTASAYSLNFTVVPPAGGPEANLTTWPATQPTMPNVSTLHYYSSVVANAAIVPAGTNDAINVYVADATNVLFDVNGYFGPAQTSGLHFYPVTPCRIADTRTGAGFTGQFGPPTMAAGTTRTFTLPASTCGVPATASAYSLNFTVVPPSGGPEANLTTWPAGPAGMPNVSTLNYYGSVVANAAIVPAGTNGAINVYVADPTNVLFDVNGYFAPAQTSGLHFYPLTPCRIADTRSDAGFTGQFGPPTMAAGATRTFTLPASTCGVPATASAYSLTAVPPAGRPEANLTTWPTGLATGMPNVSTLNYYGSVVANAAIVPAGTNGAINVYVVDPTDVLIDINGYFAQ